ncbi:MAG TPA: carboxy terminal-processing peptidase, partial [Fibrobacteria bacterium]|nr:carboxy terminal-processing peptidase [Fibrobacteria bacterium]
MIRFRSVRFALFLALASAFASDQPNKEELLTRIVVKSLGSWHYDPPKLEDSYARRVFTLHLKRIDPQRRFLLQEDVDSLKRYETVIDDEVKDGSTRFFDYASILLRNRIRDAQDLSESILDKTLDLDAEDSLPAEPEKQPWAKNRDELRKRWARLLKYQILTHIQDERESRAREAKETKDTAAAPKAGEKGGKKGKSAVAPKTKVKTPVEEEREARAFVARSTKRMFDRMLKEDRLARLSAYLNTVGNAYDPHTEYFKPEAKEEFDLSMTGTLEGIGAVLREEDGYIKVVSIVPGSASWRQKELKAEDKILKVAQGAEEPVDLVESSVNDAVKLIRGRKGTEVRLTVQKPSGRIQVIPIIRDVVIVEETYAKSAVVAPPDSAAKRKFGYILLPAFYHDFNNSKGRTASGDVKIELERLKAEGVQGVVLDFRNNGGGALDDAVKMAGLFIKSGPIVQIKDQKGNGMVLQDQDAGVVYDGPLVILTNTFSASASEIVAAALQDYGRAVIMGSDTSFGKGTVQSMLDLDAYLPPAFASARPLGSLKLTIQKFYRINGGSTQYKGVVPDIQIPDAYTDLEIGEKTLEYALPWDTVAALPYVRSKDKLDLGGLRKKSIARTKVDPTARLLADLVDRLQERRDKAWLSLKKSRFFMEQESARKETERLDSLGKENGTLRVISLDSKSKAMADTMEAEKGKRWQDQLARDLYIREAVNVLSDL